MFRLEIHPSSTSEPIVTIIDLSDERAALQEARTLIALELGAPGAFVKLTADGRFTVGAGFRVRNGHYVLQPTDRSGLAR